MPAKNKKINDNWFRFIGVPLCAFMGHIIFYNRNDNGDERFGFWIIYLLSLAETMVLWEVNRFAILRIRQWFPSMEQTYRRIGVSLVVCMVLTVVVRSLNMLLYDKTAFWGYQFPIEAYLQSIAVALLFVIIVGGFYEGIYYFQQWKSLVVETETLKRESLQTQLDSLKAQINPHFLFNSLGSLSSLIEESPEKAQDFVAGLSQVYRYLLQSNEQTLISLQKEMDFIDAYYSLLQTRFTQGLQLKTSIDAECMEMLLPPLTLQLLLENAVKHNAVLPARPLVIEIFTDNEQYLHVRNNLQTKSSPVPSNKTGLNNIVTKYELLRQPNVRIAQTDTHFEVAVPLIPKAAYASNDR